MRRWRASSPRSAPLGGASALGPRPELGDREPLLAGIRPETQSQRDLQAISSWATVARTGWRSLTTGWFAARDITCTSHPRAPRRSIMSSTGSQNPHTSRSSATPVAAPKRSSNDLRRPDCISLAWTQTADRILKPLKTCCTQTRNKTIVLVEQWRCGRHTATICLS